MQLFTGCSCYGMAICPLCRKIALAVIAVLVGTLMAWKPRKTIDVQEALYRPFNWNLKPISMEKQIRITRILGFILFGLGIFALAIYIIVK